MSVNGRPTTSGGEWPQRRISKRNKLRNGTFVIPTTGERSRRQFTLRTSSSISETSTNTSEQDEYAETARERLCASLRGVKKTTLKMWQWLDSQDGHGVLKCTLAYFLGSMGTFFPPLSDFLGHRDGKHIVATLTVYFHPARTAGSMLEAILIAVIAVVYAEAVSLLSMGIAIASRATTGFVSPAHLVILIICIGGGLGFVGWVKQRMNHPVVNVGSTLASIAIISVITKEESVQDGYFSADKIIQVLKMLGFGVTFTTAVNLLVWHLSARRVLRQSAMDASVAMSDKLSLITRGFLNGTEDGGLHSCDYAAVSQKYDSLYALMSKTTREAKFEHYFLGREKIYRLDKRLVKSVEALAQAIGGLRSALNTQLTLMNETPSDAKQDGSASSNSPLSPKVSRAMSAFIMDARERLAVIDEQSESDDDEASRPPPRIESDSSLGKSPLFKAPSDIFALFITLLGPSMKSLAFTLSETLRESPFGEDPCRDIIVNDQLRESLRDASTLFNNARASALQELYRSIELGRARSEKIQADIEEVAAACGHFSFSLLAVAEETDAYLGVLEELKYVSQTSDRSWNWLKFWNLFGRKKEEDPQTPDPEREALLQKQTVRPLKGLAIPKGIPTTMVQRKDTFNWDAAPHASQIMRWFSQKTLKFMRFVAREDILFGIKVGIGAVLWAMFAFIDSTRPIYQLWRGEWGLLSFMIVAAMTTGSANTTGTARFKGTLIGAAASCASWLIGQENPFVLAFLGALIAFGNFYMILVVKNGPLGRISLLAYNVITLYAYSISQKVDDDDDDEGGSSPLIFEITYHRVIAVTLGIIWGIVVCRFLWPISGRRKFREGLSVLYLQLGLIWKRGPLGVMLDSNSMVDYMREGEQAALQRYAFKLDSLRSSAKSEFELRGPFPDAAYGRIMRSTRHVLDGMYAMRLITQKRLSLSPGERALIEATSSERNDLCRRMCHVFQVLASCIMLEYPLTDAIPTVETNKDRLLGKIYKFRKEHMKSNAMANDGHSDGSNSSDGGSPPGVSFDATADGVVTEEKDYALLYAYTLVSAQVAEELKNVRREIEGLFGVLNEESLLLE